LGRKDTDDDDVDVSKTTPTLLGIFSIAHWHIREVMTSDEMTRLYIPNLAMSLMKLCAVAKTPYQRTALSSKTSRSGSVIPPRLLLLNETRTRPELKSVAGIYHSEKKGNGPISCWTSLDFEAEPKMVVTTTTTWW
jgi:hypothetical protein